MKTEKKPKVKLIGQNGNAFAIIGAVRRALRDAGRTADEIAKVSAEMQEGDYNHLLQVASKHCDIR